MAPQIVGQVEERFEEPVYHFDLETTSSESVDADADGLTYQDERLGSATAFAATDMDSVGLSAP